MQTNIQHVTDACVSGINKDNVVMDETLSATISMYTINENQVSTWHQIYEKAI